MKPFITVSIVFVFYFSSYAQKAKPGVIVFGATPAGLAAAIQSAHSGVKTILADAGPMDYIELDKHDKTYKTGVYAEFLKRVDSLQKGNPINNQNLIPSYVASVFKGWTDTIKNLTVLRRAQVKKIKREGKNWKIELSDQREIKAEVVVDATTDDQLSKLASVESSPVKLVTGVYSNKLYRTIIAPLPASKGAFPAGLPLSALINEKAENFIKIGGEIPTTMPIGQAAGASAAYCAFFNTLTSKIDVRKTQGELIAFGASFIQFGDIPLADLNSVSIQKIALTGILKGQVNNSQLFFMPDSIVVKEDIRQPMQEYFSRSQIWFLDNKASTLTLQDVLSLIKFTANRGAELDKEVESGWNTSLKLKGKFDPKKPITRRELATLFDLYLKPFERGIDLKGFLKA